MSVKSKITRAETKYKKFLTHEAGWVGGVCPHFSVNLDQSLLDD